MQDSLLIEKIIKLQDSGDFQSAKQLVYERLSNGLSLSEPHDILMKFNLAGMLIDIGNESYDEQTIDDGLNIIEKDRAIFCQHVTESSLEYNIGNGIDAKFKIYASQPNFEFKPETISLLTEAKNHYWRSYKLLSENTLQQSPQLLTNLANSLSQSGRIAEALPYYDLVLQYIPNFPYAHANRADALIRLYHLSGSYSINLLHQVRKGFELASLSPEIPALMKQKLSEKYEQVQETLHQMGFSGEDEHDEYETQQETDAHSTFRHFCLENHLCLSEHALYCTCAGARNDDLAIPPTKQGISGDFVPQMELLLNRLKAEFSLARFLFYQEGQDSREYLEVYDKEMMYTELFEGEVIGTRAEMLRTSFRMCFGILDKIAHGICELFNLANPNETIYFESFWRNRQNLARWNKINTLDNLPLSALYSQATDLNMKFGEWGMFKNWRNLLEHKLLCLITDNSMNQDVYGVFTNNVLFERIPYSEFKFKTFRLLQLTRSAIFNFVFCVRREGMKHDNTKVAIPITLGFKV